MYCNPASVDDHVNTEYTNCLYACAHISNKSKVSNNDWRCYLLMVDDDSVVPRLKQKQGQTLSYPVLLFHHEPHPYGVHVVFALAKVKSMLLAPFASKPCFQARERIVSDRKQPSGQILHLVKDLSTSSIVLHQKLLLHCACLGLVCFVVFYQVPLPNLPVCLDGYSLGMISDIHAGPTVGRAEVSLHYTTVSIFSLESQSY